MFTFKNPQCRSKSTLSYGCAWLVLVILTVCTLGSGSAVADGMPEWVKKGLPIKHPGKIPVEYLGQIQVDPPRYAARFAGELFILFEGAIGPDYHTAQLLEHARFQPGERVLEIGTGIGPIAIFAARAGAQVVATDISPIAVANTRYNADRLGVSAAIDVREGDLFAPIRSDELFDVILFNVIYPYNDKTLHHWALHERFFAEVGRYLAPGGRIYYQAGYLDNLPHIRSMINDNGFVIDEMHLMSVRQYRRQPMVFVIIPKSDWK